ncbi:hypothetical protein AB0K87_31560 [Streptomyces sp. NPDC053705]|uniref:hypothetical protein n=1 Tax=Streptomyces sp. NPDC053705 TaxID=3156668 RepID=UPI0034160ED7
MALVPHQSRGRGTGAVQDERGHDQIVGGVLDLGHGGRGGPSGLVHGLGDVGEVGRGAVGSQDGLGADGGAADLPGRVAECRRGLVGRQGRVGEHEVGDAVGAQA